MKKSERITCLSCNGTGVVYSPKTGTRTCGGCNGKGYIQIKFCRG